ncbi:amino acid adenylation domain-containing protein [Streptomyces sp. NPDC005181]|uniref:amino acid adenylation domain-containing protein n=1 Tax=Streptomyces sp. NPDC005181 TaxID=3156869 RepID=UPI0033A04D58
MDVPTSRSPYVFGERIDRAVAHHAAQRPHAVAVQQAERTLSYGELTEQSVVVAAALRGLGVTPGQHVVVRMVRSPELVTALLGVLRAGAAYVAVDPEWPQGRVAETVQGTSAALVITDLPGAPAEEQVRSFSIASLLSLGSNTPAPEQQDDGTVTASVFYTSGSTGKPKGVLSPHRGTIRTLVNCPAIPLDQDSVFLQAAPLPWDGLSLELWAPLLNGGRCVLLDQGLRALDSEALAEAIRQGVDSLWLTSSLFNVMAEERIEVFGKLRLLLVGGERVSVTSARRVLTEYPSLHMVNGYGPAESTIFATNHVIRPVDVAEDSTEIPIGTPVPHTTVVLLGADGRPVADGQTGEITVGGDGVALGYAGNPEETARRFYSADGMRFYRTGDLAVRDVQGLLRYRGRADHQFKIRGIRIEPGEVEAVLEAHPEVTACCVLPLELAPGRVQLAAVYTTADGRPVEAEQLRKHAALVLLDAMVPTLVHHVDQLPLNTNGKADRKAAEQLLREQFTGTDDVAASGDDSAVLGEVRALLGLVRLTERDDLLLAGANSLDAIRLAARIGARFGARITASDIYRLRTVEAITAHCETAMAPAEELPSPQGDSAAAAPLSHAQQRFWLTEMMNPGAADNMIVLAYSLTGPLAPQVLEEALNDVVAHHPVLRTIYPWVDEAPVQQILPPEAAVLALEHVDPPAAAAGPEPLGLQDLAEAATADWWHTPFSLGDEVPFRVRLCRLADERHLLCLQVHHIAFDGWSESVLMTALQRAYGDRLAARAPEAAPQLTYGQFSAWEATRLDHWAQRDLPFWREQLDSVPPAFLPAPSAAPAGSPRRHELVLTVDAETVGRLSLAAARRGGPVVASLVAAAGRAIARTFGTGELALGSVTAGRFDPALEPVVGYFVNPFTVTLTAALDSSPVDLLNQSVARVVSYLTHVNTPFDELVRAFAPPRNRHPWFQAWVVLQGQPPCGDLGGQVAVEPIRVRPPNTDIELMLEAFPAAGGSWDLVVLWREDGISASQAELLVAELSTALEETADCV